MDFEIQNLTFMKLDLDYPYSNPTFYLLSKQSIWIHKSKSKIFAQIHVFKHGTNELEI